MAKVLPATAITTAITAAFASAAVATFAATTPPPPPPLTRYVALSCDDRYYIDFQDGSSQWVGDEDGLFNEKVKAGKSRGGIATVSFGEEGVWFIVYGDGGFYHSGGVPSGLVEKLKARGDRDDLEYASLGPEGEWYVKCGNGRSWWGGIQHSSNLLEDTKGIKDRITSMLFADDDRWFVRYE